MLVEMVVVVVLLLINGFFAMSELALVSSRQARLEMLATDGHRGARVALRLLENPGRMLSTVQIGITLVGVLAGAFSGATLALRFAGVLQDAGFSVATADAVAVAVVVSAVTYLSLIVGELVPKQIALANPERIAAGVAPFMRGLAAVSLPAIWLLDVSSRWVLALLRITRQGDQRVSEEEIRALVREATSAGTVEPAEREMITEVMRLGDRSVRAVMTPRTDLDWVDLDAGIDAAVARLIASPHARLPAAQGRIDEVRGVLVAKDVLAAVVSGTQPSLMDLVREVPALHDQADALAALRLLKDSRIDMALVVDEYGSFEGVVTAADLLQAIAGAFREHDDADDPGIFRREDGSWLLDGMLPVDQLWNLLAIREPKDDDEDYHTIAGFVLARLRRMPVAGDRFDWEGWRFEVVDMDGRRIDKILVGPIDAE